MAEALEENLRLEFRRKFGCTGVVILPVIHVRDFEEACKNVQICKTEKAPGAFLINHDFRVQDFIPILKRIRARFPKFWLGVNLLGYNGIQTFQTIKEHPDLASFNAYWCDNGMIDVRDETFTLQLDKTPKLFTELNKSKQVEVILVSRSSRDLPLRKGDIILELNDEPVPKDVDDIDDILKSTPLPFSLKILNKCRADAKVVLELKKEVGYSGMYFGGVAFKGQGGVAKSDFRRAAAVGSALMDAVVTSGKKTGSAIDLDKLKEMRLGVENAPLLVASGINAENFKHQATFIDAAFVATGISTNFYNIDATKLRELLNLAQEATL